MVADVCVSLQLLIFFEINSAKWKSNIIQQKNSGRFTLMLPGLMPVIVMVSTIRIIVSGSKPCTAVEKYIQRTEMQMRNALLKLRFLLLNLTGYFKDLHYEDFWENQIYCFSLYPWLWQNLWDDWMPNEHWGNVKDAENPYIIWLADQVSFKDNVVHLTTDLNDGTPKIKSGQLCSWKFLYRTYGAYFATIKVPPNGGRYWFSMWLIGKECREEIDVFEMMDSDSKGFTVTLHGWVDGEKKIVFSRHFRLRVDLSESFHRYGVDWQKDHVAWYLDGIKLCEYRGKHIPDCDMGLIINNAVSRGFKPDGIPESLLKEMFPMSGLVSEIDVFESC